MDEKWSLSLQHYLIEETVVSYLDVRRRVRDSLKHVYLTDRPKGAQCPMGSEERGKNRELLLSLLAYFDFNLMPYWFFYYRFLLYLINRFFQYITDTWHDSKHSQSTAWFCKLPHLGDHVHQNKGKVKCPPCMPDCTHNPLIHSYRPHFSPQR